MVTECKEKEIEINSLIFQKNTYHITTSHMLLFFFFYCNILKIYFRFIGNLEILIVYLHHNIKSIEFNVQTYTLKW